MEAIKSRKDESERDSIIAEEESRSAKRSPSLERLEKLEQKYQKTFRH